MRVFLYGATTVQTLFGIWRSFLVDAAGRLGMYEASRVISGPTSIIDSGGSPVALTDAYTGPGGATDSDWIDLDDDCARLALILKTAAATPTSVDIEVLWSTQAAASVTSYFIEPVVDAVSGGAELLAPRESKWRGRGSGDLPTSNPQYRRAFERPPEAASYCVRLKRGSAVAVTAQMYASQLG